MITKFLYEIDESKRKVISAMVVNQDAVETFGDYPFIEQITYKSKDNDVITLNNGKLVYVVFNDNNKKKYLDVSVTKTGVKVSLTDNISHAACLSEQMATTILFNYDYFDLEDSEFIESGFYKNKYNRLTDQFDNFFRKASNDAYCQIRKGANVYFLSRNESNNYCLSPDFSKAAKILKNDVRKILTVYNIINENTQKSDISFSKFNCFTNGSDYLFAGEKPLRVKFEQNLLTIDTDGTKILYDDKIINNEDVYMKLKNIFFNLNKPLTDQLSYLKYDKHFIQKQKNTYKLVSNPVEATLLDEKDIKIFKSAISIFVGECEFTRYAKDSLFAYYTEDNTFMFTDIPQSEYNSGLIVKRSDFEEYQRNLNSLTNDKTEGVIVIKDKKYLQVGKTEKGHLKILWLDTAYHATVLTEKLVLSLTNIFKWDIQKRVIKNLIKDNNTELFNIKYDNDDEEQDVLTEYEKILSEINDKKHRICSFELPSSIRPESEKGALEYLRRFYLKGIYDTSKLFEIVLTNYSFLKNILIVGPGAHLSLIGLNQIARKLDKKVTVATVNHSRWGYYPKISLTSNVSYKAAYRFEFINLVNSIVDSYDMILFSQGFNEEEENVWHMLDSIMDTPKDLVIANVRFSNFEKQTDSVYNYFKSKLTLRRKMFNHEIQIFKEGLSMDKIALEKQQSEICRCYKPSCDVSKVAVENENSYHTIVFKEKLKVKDHYKN